MEIRRIDIFSAAKVVGLLYATLGFLVSLIFACMGVLSATVLTPLLNELGASVEELGAGIGGSVGFALMSICLFPIFYGVMGAIAGAIGAILYNLIAGRFGGLIIETRDAKSY